MTTLTPDLVRRAGLALFGEEWQVPLARLLDVNERTVRRIAQAAREGRDYHISQAWTAELRTALTKAARDLELRSRIAAEVAALLEHVDGAA